MKRLLILILLCFTLAISTDARMSVMQLSGGGGDTRPDYYAQAVLSINFKNGLNAYDSDGNAVEFSTSGEDIGAFGDGGGQAMKIDAKGEGITFTQTAQQYIDETGAQTICVKANVAAALDADVVLLVSLTEVAETNDRLLFAIQGSTSESVKGYWDTEGADASAVGGSLGYAAWKTMSYSWDKPNADHSANPGDEPTPDNWASGWEDDDNELGALSMTEDPTIITFGSHDVHGNAPSQIYYIDEIAIINSYKFDCSTLW